MSISLALASKSMNTSSEKRKLNQNELEPVRKKRKQEIGAPGRITSIVSSLSKYLSDLTPTNGHENNEIENLVANFNVAGKIKDKTNMNHLLLVTSKMAVIVSRVVMHHIRGQMSIHQEPLDFMPNNSYFSKIGTLISKGNLSATNQKFSYVEDNSLQQSINAVFKELNIDINTFREFVDQSPITKLGFNQIMNSHYIKLQTNMKIHCDEKSKQCLENLAKNLKMNLISVAITDDVTHEGLKLHREVYSAVNRIPTEETKRPDFFKKLKLSEKASAEVKRINLLKIDNCNIIDYISKCIQEENNKLIDFKKKKDEIKYPGILFLMYTWQVKVSDMIDTRLNNENKSQFSYFSIFPQFKIKLHSMHIDNIVLKELIRYHLLKQFKCDVNGEIIPLRKKAITAYIENILANNVTLWNKVFNLNGINKLRNKGTFQFTCDTDGIKATFQFTVALVEDTGDLYTTVKVRKSTVKTQTAGRTIGKFGLFNEKDLKRLADQEGGKIFDDVIAIDPGNDSPVVGAAWDDDSKSPVMMKQGNYEQNSGMRLSKKSIGSQSKYFNDMNMKDVTAELGKVPSSYDVKKTNENLNGLGIAWERQWSYHSTTHYRKTKFAVYRQRERFMDKSVNDILALAGNSRFICFGNGADNGFFGRLRGAGVHGPVLEFRKRLAKKKPVIIVDEFRSSCLCFGCSTYLKFVGKNGYSNIKCDKIGCNVHNTQNRDVSAAKKIAAIAAARALNVVSNVYHTVSGAWSRSVKREILKSDNVECDPILKNFRAQHCTAKELRIQQAIHATFQMAVAEV